MKGIVITTSEFSKDWLPECLNSLKTVPYSVLVVSNGGYIPDVSEWDVELVINDWNGFELGGILRGCEHFDEFIHLMDTCEVVDDSFIETMFDHDGGMYFCDGFFSYLGKYVSSHIEKLGVPRITDKQEAIKYERDWNKMYLKLDKQAEQFLSELPIHTDVFEQKHGRRNMILDNGFIRKYKAFWSI